MSEQLSGRDLDRAIAEALGYFVEKSINGREWILIDPEMQHTGDENWVNSEAQAWQMIPAFHADANAVIDVCAARGWYLSFTGNSALIAYDIGGGFSRTHRGDGATPQEAAARALLAAITAETGAA